jgi:SAM-dependent methyltransferase
MDASGPNKDQIEYWNNLAGQKWVAEAAQLDRMLQPLGEAALARAAARAGERVLDIGCGNGQTALALAARVGPTGSVLGVDISKPMLDVARMRASAEKRTQLRFENADAQTFAFAPASFDLAFSRFGVMFFSDPVAAFANVARALVPGGRLVFVCWQALLENAWMREPMQALAKHLTLPPPPPPDAPGPFAFANPERVRGILERAGFRDVRLEPKTGALVLGGSLDEAAHMASEVGPAGALLREAAPAVRATALAAIREVVAARATPNGVEMPYAVWIASGVR